MDTAKRYVELGVGRARLGESRRNLARGHAPAHHSTLGEKRVPGREPEDLDSGSRSRHGGPCDTRAQDQPGLVAH